jgi:hypothetical protein
MQRRGKYAVWVLAMYTVRKPVKRLSLRTAYASATLAALLTALSAEPALAHLVIQPTLLEQGVVTDVSIELPQLRPGSTPRRLEVAGEGIDVISSDLQGTSGTDTLWKVRLRATADPGVAPVVLRAVYADAKSVEVDQQFTVAPAPEQSSFPWIGVVVGALLAVAVAVFSLRLARRKA